MDPKHFNQHVSKFLSFVLRHDPDNIDITLDAQGWTDCEILLARLQSHFPGIDRNKLLEIVASSDKRRFALSEDQTRIRASQGHSVEIDLTLTPLAPPELLYHGTVDRCLPAIQNEGLAKGQRHHVHLSADRPTATRVGERRGKPVILVIRATEMSASGHLFYRSENGVWLADAVPPEFIDFP